MHNMFMKNSEEEDEDEWFYDSIRRYKQLRMFDFENIIMQIELSDPRTICVVGKHTSGRHEILELSLPEKLTVAPSQEGLVKNTDLKMKSGGFTNAPVAQMKALWNKRKVIVSEKNQSGASVYNLGSEDSDLITRVGSLSCELVAPSLALNNQDLILLTAATRRSLVVMDFVENKIIHKQSFDSGNEIESSLEPAFASENLTALCENSSGNVRLYDINIGKICGEFCPGKNDFKGGGFWTIKSSYDSEKNVTPSLGNKSSNIKLGLVSSHGKLLIYDLRNTSVALCEADIGKKIVCRSEDDPQLVMNFCPDDNSKVSLSGFDENVHIYDVSSTEQFKTVFVHDGHARQSNTSKKCCVTSHAWYRQNTVISASENSWLHCWQFIAEGLLT